MTIDQAQWLEDAMPAIREQLEARGLVICGSEAYLERIDTTASNQSLSINDCLPGTAIAEMKSFSRLGKATAVSS
ncbi:MAG: hypothetical protein SGI77_23205 [Pirellulaceae bacterium]|nr:hypothetical protein [Pirellulaceae bacterium]